MRASQIVAVAFVAGALVTAIGVRAWLNSPDAESTATQADVRGASSAKDPVLSAPFAPKPTAAAVTAVQSPAPQAPAPSPNAAASAVPATAAPATTNPTSLEARMAEAASESAHRTERFLHSRRDDGQHAE